MSILEEENLNQITQKFTELDFKDTSIAEKVEEIINDVLKDNVDKIGTVTKSTTIDEALAEEKEGFEELKKLQEEGILEYVENEDLKNALNANASEGIKDEEAEKFSLEEAGYVAEALKEAKTEDILEEIFKRLEEVIEEKKKALDKKIEENEAMRSKVEKREQLKIAKAKVSNLYQKTQNYKGTEGKNLNQNVGAAVADLDMQLVKLTKETSRDGVEMTDAMLDEENQKFEEEKKNLDDLLSKIKESYKKKDNENIKLDLIEKQIDDITEGITANMEFKDLRSKSEALYTIYDQNKETKGILELFQNKMITIKKEDARGIEKEIQLSASSITDAGMGRMNKIRADYMNHTSKENKTEEDKERIQDDIIIYKKYKNVFETICGDSLEIAPLMTEQEYINEFEELEKNAEKNGVFGSGKANKVAQQMQRIHKVLEGFISRVDKNSRIIEAYKIVAGRLYYNSAVKDSNLPPKTLIQEKRKETVKKIYKEENPNNHIEEEAYRKMQETQEQISKDVTGELINRKAAGDVEKFSGDVIDKDGKVIKSGQGEVSPYNYGYSDSNDGSR